MIFRNPAAQRWLWITAMAIVVIMSIAILTGCASTRTQSATLPARPVTASRPVTLPEQISLPVALSQGAYYITMPLKTGQYLCYRPPGLTEAVYQLVQPGQNPVFTSGSAGTVWQINWVMTDDAACPH